MLPCEALTRPSVHLTDTSSQVRGRRARSGSSRALDAFRCNIDLMTDLNLDVSDILRAIAVLLAADRDEASEGRSEVARS